MAAVVIFMAVVAEPAAVLFVARLRHLRDDAPCIMPHRVAAPPGDAALDSDDWTNERQAVVEDGVAAWPAVQCVTADPVVPGIAMTAPIVVAAAAVVVMIVAAAIVAAAVLPVVIVAAPRAIVAAAAPMSAVVDNRHGRRKPCQVVADKQVIAFSA